MSKYLRMLALVVAALIAGSTAFATGNLLAPGGSVAVPVAALPPGTVVGQTQQKGLTNGVNYTASEVVYQETGTGNIDFLLQVSLRKGSSKVNAYTTATFGGFVTNVFDFANGTTVPGQVVLSNGTIASPMASRTPAIIDNGAQITFGFGKGGITAGTTSYVTVIQTQATTFNQLAAFTLVNANTTRGNVGLSSYFQPIFIPEPSTFVLWGGLFAGAALTMVWRQRRTRALAVQV